MTWEPGILCCSLLVPSSFAHTWSHIWLFHLRMDYYWAWVTSWPSGSQNVVLVRGWSYKTCLKIPCSSRGSTGAQRRFEGIQRGGEGELRCFLYYCLNFIKSYSICVSYFLCARHCTKFFPQTVMNYYFNLYNIWSRHILFPVYRGNWDLGRLSNSLRSTELVLLKNKPRTVWRQGLIFK